MGIVAKSISKRQAAPQTGPVNTGVPKDLPWLTNEYIVVGAVLRSACLRLGLAGTKSITTRGATSAFTPAFASSLWCETVSATRWRCYLGAIGAQQRIAADWVLEIRIENGVVTITTPNYLTRDGKLEHSAAHSTLREALLQALAFGAPEAGALETQASAAALSHLVSPSQAVPPAGGGQITIRTQLGERDLGQVLSRVGLPVISWSRSSWCWGLGLDAQQARNWVALHHQAGGAVAEVSGELHLDEAGPVLHRRVAHAAARTWLQRAEFLLRQQDPSVVFDGPALHVAGE